jgi:D-aspartate ligase
MTETAITLAREIHSKDATDGGRILPPVLILNLFYTGLGIARSLAGRGIRVVGLSAHRHIYGNFSRYCEVRFSPNSQEEPEQLAEFLLGIAPEFEGAIIFPTRDADVLLLDRFRSELEEHYRLAIPPHAVLMRVIDKAALVDAAIRAGVPVPRTAVVRDITELQLGAEKAGFPCVVKPVSSVHWRQGQNWDVVGRRKAFRADNVGELQREYKRVSKVRSEILLQEWIPGRANDIVVLGGYVSKASEFLACFTARKVLQSPEEFGTGCVVETDNVPGLFELGSRLCRTLKYEGMAEIEFKRDTRDGQLKLIEINTRHWDWHQLGQASGVNVSWTAYAHLSGQPGEMLPYSVRHCKWVAEDAFVTHALAGLYRGESGPLGLWRQVAGHRMYGIFSWKDPVPFLRYSVGFLAPTLAKAAIGKIREQKLRSSGPVKF